LSVSRSADLKIVLQSLYYIAQRIEPDFLCSESFLKAPARLR
jgi:hypothetical protein